MWVEALCWIHRVWSSKECACDPSVHLSVPSIGFVYVKSMSEVISSFWSLRAGSQVFAPLMLFLCVILHIIWSSKSLQLLWYIVLSVIRIFVKILLAVCMLVGNNNNNIIFI